MTGSPERPSRLGLLLLFSAGLAFIIAAVKYYLVAALVPLGELAWGFLAAWVLGVVAAGFLVRASGGAHAGALVLVGTLLVPNVLLTPWEYEMAAAVEGVPAPEGGTLVEASGGSTRSGREGLPLGYAQWTYPADGNASEVFTEYAHGLEADGWTVVNRTFEQNGSSVRAYLRAERAGVTLRGSLHRDLAVESPVLTTYVYMPYFTSVARAYTSGDRGLPFNLPIPVSDGDCADPANATGDGDGCIPAPREEGDAGSGAASS